MSKKLQEILRKNIEFERESPYNFCDRWCERCIHEKQIRCKLYKDEMERKITCIAHGRDENDPEITEVVMDVQYKEAEGKLIEHMDKFSIDLDNPDIDEVELDEEDAVDFEALPPEIQKQIRFVENNLLDATAKNYSGKAHSFLEKTFYKDDKTNPDIKNYFEIVSWYHTLLPAKIHRALCGFHEPVCENEFALYDAVAQFEICKKGIEQSVDALRRIINNLSDFNSRISELIALLGNIHSRINVMEGSI